MHQAQVNVLPRKLLTQSLWLAAGIARHIRSLLHIRQSDELHVRVGLEHRLEALQRGVNRATQRRRSHQLDTGVAREVIAQLAALLVAKVCEEGVGNDVVGSREVVDALEEQAVSSVVKEVMSTLFSIREFAQLSV